MEMTGLAFCYRKSAESHLRWLFLRRLGTSLTLRFSSLIPLIQRKAQWAGKHRACFPTLRAFLSGDDGTRTRHFQIANLTLYQMSYIPVEAFQPSSFALRISNMVVHVQISSGLK